MINTYCTLRFRIHVMKENSRSVFDVIILFLRRAFMIVIVMSKLTRYLTGFSRGRFRDLLIIHL